jgi:putative salt-induced outer membrane protein YdiY
MDLKGILRVILIYGIILPIKIFSQDQLIFENGDILSGNYLGKTESLIYFESEHLGTVIVPSGIVQLKLDGTPDRLNVPLPQTEEIDKPVLVDHPDVEAIESVLDAEISEIETQDDSRTIAGLSQLWESTERTLNRFINDKVPGWFPVLPEAWKGELKLGFNLNKAAQTSTRYFGEFGFGWDKPKNGYNFSTYFAYAEQNKIQSENDWGLSTRFRYKLESTDFVETLGSHDVDELFDPAKRSTASIGYGLKPYKSDKLSFDYVIGGAIESLDRRIGTVETFFKFNINENFQWKFNKHLTLKQNLRFYINPTDEMNYNFRFDSTLQALIVGAFNLGVSYRMDYDSSIKVGDGRHKTKFVTSLGVKF